jgi:hypothetical protein
MKKLFNKNNYKHKHKHKNNQLKTIEHTISSKVKKIITHSTAYYLIYCIIFIYKF